MYLNIIRQLKTNKTLKATLENPETCQAFAAALWKTLLKNYSSIPDTERRLFLTFQERTI